MFCVIIIFETIVGCPIRKVTGYSCPGCGMTRAYIALFLNADIKTAYYYHPLFFLGLPIAFLIISELFGFTNKFTRRMLVFFAIILLIVYFIRLFGGFSNNLPLDKTNDNIFTYILSVLS